MFRGKMGLAQQVVHGGVQLWDDSGGLKKSNKGKKEHWLNQDMEGAVEMVLVQQTSSF